MASDWQIRTELLVGRDGLERLASATVAVVGIGGVGGYAAEMLVRAGVGHLIILDSDVVSESNKNRQLLALSSTVGKPKCEVLGARLRDINPDLDLVCIREYLEPAYKFDGTPIYGPDFKELTPSAPTADEPRGDGTKTPAALLGPYKIDFLVDAIDTLTPKISLIKYCVDSHIPLVSSMGAGAKYDITKIRITDISKSFNCPLAYMVRKKLHRMGILRGFKAVFSEELPDENAFAPCEDKNKRSMTGTISYLPAAFGCACAQAALHSLLAKPSASEG